MARDFHPVFFPGKGRPENLKGQSLSLQSQAKIPEETALRQAAFIFVYAITRNGPSYAGRFREESWLQKRKVV